MATATAKLIETHRNGAEIHHGDICKEKIQKLLEEFSMPKGLLPLDEIEEFGFNRTTGFLWIHQKKKKEHKFKSVGTVIYNVEITGFVEKGHLSKLTGISSSFLIPVVINDLLVGSPAPNMIKITTAVGLSKSHPVSAFELENGGK